MQVLSQIVVWRFESVDYVLSVSTALKTTHMCLRLIHMVNIILLLVPMESLLPIMLVFKDFC